jgi:hypothetical protein
MSFLKEHPLCVLSDCIDTPESLTATTFSNDIQNENVKFL